MTLRTLVNIDKLFYPAWWLLWRIGGLVKVSSHDKRTAPVVVVKLMGMGSITRITSILEDRGVSKSQVLFCTFRENEDLGKLLGYPNVHYLDRGVFAFFRSCLNFLLLVKKERPRFVIDFERCSNLVGIFRILLGMAGSCPTAGFDNISSDTRKGGNQVFAVGNLGLEELVSKAAVYFEIQQYTQKYHEVTATPGQVLININASNYLLSRRYPRGKFLEVVLTLHHRNPALQFFFTGTANEREYVEELCSQLRLSGINAHNKAGDWTILELANMLATAAVFITNDSGPLHLAAYLGTPTIAIWGPTHFQQFGYSNPAIHNVHAGTSCSPCFFHPKSKHAISCNGKIDCMKDLSPQQIVTEVLAAVEVQSDVRQVRSFPGMARTPREKVVIYE